MMVINETPGGPGRGGEKGLLYYGVKRGKEWASEEKKACLAWGFENICASSSVDARGGGKELGLKEGSAGYGGENSKKKNCLGKLEKGNLLHLGKKKEARVTRNAGKKRRRENIQHGG